MKPTRLLIALVLLVLAPRLTHAEGVISMTWDGCTGPINKITAAGVPAELYVTVLGCQGAGLIVINHIAPSSVVKTCPTFQGAAQSFQVKDFSYDALYGTARMVLYDSYPNNGGIGPPLGNPAATNPAQRYFLGRFLFDETFGVTGPTNPGVDCGGLEKGLCFFLELGDWLDLAGNEIPWARERNYITTNGPVSFSFPYSLFPPDTCDPPVLARPVTWGSIKNQYR